MINIKMVDLKSRRAKLAAKNSTESSNLVMNKSRNLIVALGLLLSSAAIIPAHAQTYDKTLSALDALRPLSTPMNETTGAFVGGGFAASQLRHLPAHPLGSRLAGESDSRTWPFYVSAAQIGKSATFRLSYMNAVAVMPEGSVMDVYVNGDKVHSMAIISSIEPSQVDITIPPQLTSVGYNAVTVSVRQRHRVDCSPLATYELWTDIVDNGTGFVDAGGSNMISSLADLPAVTLSADGKVRIRALLPDKPSDQTLQNFFDFAQMITLAGGFNSPVIEIGESFGPGIDIFVGTHAELSTRAPDLAGELNGPGPFYIVSNADTGTMFMAMVTDEPLTRGELRSAVPIAEVQGSPLGLQALAAFSPARVYEGRTTTLRALGFRDEEFNGRLYRRSFQVVLSPDFYPADYDVVKLNLSAAYAPGLSRKSGMAVLVNGVTNTSIALSNTNGDIFENKGIELALSAFKAGQNRIEIETFLIKEEDTEDCPVNISASEEPARFLLSPSSSIELPNVAHFGLLPDLGNTLRSGFPHVGASEIGETEIFLGNRDEGTLSAAGSVVAHLAASAGQPVNFVVKTGFPRGDESNAIMIGAVNELSQNVTQNMSFVDMSATRVAWTQPRQLETLDPNGTEITVDTAPTGALELSADGSDDDAASEELKRFREKWTGDAAERARFPVLHRLQERITGWLADAGGAKSDGQLPMRLNGETSDLIITQDLAPSGRGVWTTITARDSNELSLQLERFLRPEPISLTTGQAVGFSARTADIINAGHPEKRSGILGAHSFTNLRLVVAGWLSNNPVIYLLIISVAIIIGGLAANRFLKTSGRQDGHATGTGEHG